MGKRAFLTRGFLIIELVVALGVAAFLFSIVTKFQKNSFLLEQESRKRLIAMRAKITKREKRAFTLIEITIYLSLVLLLSFFLMGIEKNVRDFSHLSHTTTDKILREELLFDVIWRDVMCASPNVSDWDEKNFLFKLGDRHIGFEPREGKIARCEWRKGRKKRYTSIIWSGQNPRQVPTLTCELDKSGEFVRGVIVKFGAGRKSGDQRWYIKLRNGPLRCSLSR